MLENKNYNYAAKITPIEKILFEKMSQSGVEEEDNEFSKENSQPLFENH